MININVRRKPGDKYVDVSVTIDNTNMDYGLVCLDEAEALLDHLTDVSEALNAFIEEHLS